MQRQLKKNYLLTKHNTKRKTTGDGKESETQKTTKLIAQTWENQTEPTKTKPTK